MLDNDKFIAAQALLKSIIEKMDESYDDRWQGILRVRFQRAIKIAEDYATVLADEEWINTGVRVPKAYWDNRDQSIIGENNRPQKTEKGWMIFTQKKNIFEFKKIMEERESTNG